MSDIKEIENSVKALNITEQPAAEGDKKAKKPESTYAKHGLMRPSDLKIGGKDMHGNDIVTKKDLARARNDLQQAQKALKAGGGVNPNAGKPPKGPNDMSTSTMTLSADGKPLATPSQALSIIAPSPTASECNVTGTSSTDLLSSKTGTGMTGANSGSTAASQKPKSTPVARAQHTTVVREQVIRPASLFSHLPQGQADMDSLAKFLHHSNTATDDSTTPSEATPNTSADPHTNTNTNTNILTLHPAFVNLGVKYASKEIVGCRARCISFLHAFKQFIKEYQPVDMQDIMRDLSRQFRNNCRYLENCRQLPLPLESIIQRCNDIIVENCRKYKHIHEISKYINENLTEWIDILDLSKSALADTSLPRIHNNDVIITYGYSSIVEAVFKHAYDNGKRFSVIVVDSRPYYYGRKLIDALVTYGITCQYTLITQVNYVMPKCTKVFVGAHSVFSDGGILSHTGTSVVAMSANRHNKPFLVCSETYKFVKRIQLDSLSYNELNSPMDVLLPTTNTNTNTHAASTNLNTTALSSLYNNTSILPTNPNCNNLVSPKTFQENENLYIINPAYDVTPAKHVSALLTEIGIVPTTSAATISQEIPVGVRKTG